MQWDSELWTYTHVHTLNIMRCTPNGTAPENPIDIDEVLTLPQQTPLNLVAVVAFEQENSLCTYVRGRGLRGENTWVKCTDRDVVALAHLPMVNALLVMYEPSDSIVEELPVPVSQCSNTPIDRDVAEPPLETDFSEPNDGVDTLSESTACSGDSDQSRHYALDPGEFDVSDCSSSSSTPVPEPQDPFVIPFKDSAMEFMADGDGLFAAGVHVILCTLGELSAGKIHSNWVNDFVTCFSMRLPTHLISPSYAEAYLHACHFLQTDDDNKHIPGCMPLHLYSETPTAYSPVSLKRYVQEVLCDPHGSRQYDDAWLSYGFSALLNSLRSTDKREPVVRRGLQHGLGTDSQKEYSEKFGEYILPGLMYDEKEAKMHVKEICSAIKRFDWPTYFHIQTANMRYFPGLAEAYAEIEARELDVRHFLVYITKVWHR